MGGRGGGLVRLACALAALLGVAPPLAAQVHHIAESPWQALGSSDLRRGVEMSWWQGHDPRSGWRADRLGLTVLVPAGEQSVFFVRATYWRLDTAGLSAFARWPQARAQDPESPDAVDPAWPFESILNGFGRPEFGAIVPLGLPLAGPGAFCLLAGLPIGTDRLYPLSAACLPVLAEWRTVRRLGGLWQAAVRVGREHSFASSGAELDGGAFPGGWRYGLEFGSDAARERGLSLAWAARELDGRRHARQLALTGWLPLAERHQVGLQLARDLSAPSGRLAAWTVSLTWRLASLQSTEKQNDKPGRQNASQDAPPEDF